MATYSDRDMRDAQARIIARDLAAGRTPTEFAVTEFARLDELCNKPLSR